MLVITRAAGKSIVVQSESGERMEITVLEGCGVKLGFSSSTIAVERVEKLAPDWRDVPGKLKMREQVAKPAPPIAI